MIASLRGEILSMDNQSAIIEVNGVGYRVMLSTQSLAAINEKGSEVTVLTTMIVREDSVSLYGFLSSGEQQLFEKLITVSGIGPKVALSALSAFNADTLKRIIADEDVTRLATVSGIGKKTAQRIILELRGVLDVNDISENTSKIKPSGTVQATDALLNMGFTSPEITVALDGFEGDLNDAAAVIRHALKRLGAS